MRVHKPRTRRRPTAVSRKTRVSAKRADEDGREWRGYEKLHGGVGECGEMGQADQTVHEDAEAKREAEDQVGEFAVERSLRIH